MRRYLIIVFILILVAATGYYYFSGKQTSFPKDSSVYKAIPISAPFFFEINSVKNIPFNNAIIHELKEAGIGKLWFDFLYKSDSIVNTFDNLPKNLLNSPFIITWGYSGRNQMVPLLITRAENGQEHRSLEAFLNAVYPPENNAYIEKEYGNNAITEIIRKKPEVPLFFSFTNGLLLVSTKQILIEQVIRQMSTSGILKSPYFREVNRTAGSEGIAFFINHARFEGFFGNILNRKSLERTDEFGVPVRFQPAAQAAKFRDYAAWSELDFQFANEHVLLKGNSAADDSLNHFLSVFKDQQPVRFQAENVLPANTSFFCSYSLSNKNTFFERLEEFYAHSDSYYHREERMKRFDRGMRTNIRNLFMQLLNDEVIVAAGTIPVNPDNKTVYFILNTHGKTAAEEQIKNLITNYAARNQKEAGDFITEFSVDNEIIFPIYQFPYPSFPGLWLGNPFTMANARYATFYNNLMVFANSEGGLQTYLRNMVNGTTLAKDMGYQNFSRNRSIRSNVNVYIDVNKIFSYRNELLSDVLLKPINEKEESIRKFGRIIWQVQNDKAVFFNSLAISFQSVPGEEAKTTWQSVIGSPLQLKPQLMTNHTNLSSRDIIIQDTQNNLQQITSSGRVRWNKPLSGSVLSEIHQVDAFRNGKLQYLFNTKEKLYLIDRNGNDVAPFPIVLPSPATNGVNVFDYHNNRNYRYFLAGEDRKIYVYDQEGKMVKGWNFDKTHQEVTTPVQHFRVDEKDFIVFKDRSNIYIKDRQGETRVTVSSRFENSGNPLVLNLHRKPKIVATDKNGKVYYIYFDGTMEEKRTARFSENHYFTVEDLDGNNVLDFIFADGNEISVMNENGKKLFSRKFNKPLIYKPSIYSFSDNQKKVGITDASTNRIYLINPDGKLQEGFPLQGNSEFSIGKISENTGGLNLVVGSEGGMLYNYTLNE